MKYSRVPLPVRILACGALLQAAGIFCYSVTGVYILAASTLDIGAYMQVLRAITAYGAPLSTLTLLTGEQNWLGFHFTPLLYLLAPLYALFPSPVFLQAVHSMAVSLAAVPLYLAAPALGLERRHACIAALAYLFNPFTMCAGVWGFMDYSLSVLWMAIALWGLAARRFRLVVLGGFLLLLTKEHYGISVMMMGLLWWKLYGDKRRGMMLAFAGLVAMVLVMLVIMPHFRGSFVHPMLAANTPSGRYAWLLLPDTWHIFLPKLIISDLMNITVLLGTFCFLPIGGAWWLLAGAADFAVILLVPHNPVAGADPHCLPLVPVLVVSACAGYMRVRSWLRSRWLVMGMASFIGLSYVYFADLPLPLSRNMSELPTKPQFSLAPEDAEAVNAIRALVPPEASLAVQINVGTFFTRRYLYVFPNYVPQVDYVVLRFEFPRKKFPAMARTDFGIYAQTAKDMLGDSNVKIIYWRNPWLVMARHGEDIPGARAEAQVALAQLINSQYLLCKLWNVQ